MNKAKTPRAKSISKFKAIEKDAIGAPTTDKDLEWEGEEVAAQSDTKLEMDMGVGTPIVLRFFDFASNPDTFKQHKPTAQELFNSHMRGIESLLWRDELKPYDAVQPRFMFSKDKSHYRFIIACIGRTGSTLLENPQTLTQLINKK